MRLCVQEWIRSVKRWVRATPSKEPALTDIYAKLMEVRSIYANVEVLSPERYGQDVDAVVDLVSRAWVAFTSYHFLSANPPEVESFVLGYITLCKTGKCHLGVTVVPKVDFAAQHMPVATLLAKLNPPKQGERRSPRPGPFDKKRIISGQNTILATINHAAKSQCLTQLVIEPAIPPPFEERTRTVTVHGPLL